MRRGPDSASQRTIRVASPIWLNPLVRERLIRVVISTPFVDGLHYPLKSDRTQLRYLNRWCGSIYQNAGAMGDATEG